MDSVETKANTTERRTTATANTKGAAWNLETKTTNNTMDNITKAQATPRITKAQINTRPQVNSQTINSSATSTNSATNTIKS